MRDITPNDGMIRPKYFLYHAPHFVKSLFIFLPLSTYFFAMKTLSTIYKSTIYKSIIYINQPYINQSYIRSCIKLSKGNKKLYIKIHLPIQKLYIEPIWHSIQHNDIAHNIITQFYLLYQLKFIGNFMSDLVFTNHKRRDKIRNQVRKIPYKKYIPHSLVDIM